MALLDFLKNKNEETTAEKATPKTDKKVTKASVAKTVSAKIVNEKFSYDAVKQPHISEKATYLAEKNKYTFDVSPRYNKNEIKKSIEGIYNVNVLGINFIKIPAKKRRLGKTQGYRKAYKKAIVTIKEGQKIEIL
ncbi:MAG: 50S ribosomal protein L23 [Sphaerochaetaceae bacterium]|nr:50S ribosomal protein L23 [Sphaerochaetaceae bacterium]